MTRLRIHNDRKAEREKRVSELLLRASSISAHLQALGKDLNSSLKSATKCSDKSALQSKIYLLKIDHLIVGNEI